MTPSNQRRQGRLAFDPSCNPAQVNPHLMSQRPMQQKRADEWLEGWKEAEVDWSRRQMEFVEDCAKVTEFMAKQSKCQHVYEFEWYAYKCDFCPVCGKDLRK